MPENLLEFYKARHQNIVSSEKAKPVRLVLRVAQRLEPNRIEGAASIYAYNRILDDVVDETPHIVPVKGLLKEEREALLGMHQPTALQNEYITKPLSDLFGDRAALVKHHLSRIIAGLEMDANVRHQQTPLTEACLRRRAFLVNYAPLAIFSIGKFGIDPIPSRKITNTMHDFGAYDNVSDIFEDLPRGLVLISQEDLKRFDLCFEDGQPLPVDKLMIYNETKRKEIQERLLHSSSAVFHLGIPLWFSTLLYCYYYSRALKLSHPLPEKHGLVYKSPLDSVHRISTSETS